MVIECVYHLKQQWKNQRRRLELNKRLTEFQKEFRKHMGIFITGAFSFVAALLWRDAIQESLYPLIQSGGSAVAYKYVVALVVSIISILVIIFISKVLSPSEK